MSFLSDLFSPSPSRPRPQPTLSVFVRGLIASMQNVAEWEQVTYRLRHIPTRMTMYWGDLNTDPDEVTPGMCFNPRQNLTNHEHETLRRAYRALELDIEARSRAVEDAEAARVRAHFEDKP